MEYIYAAMILNSLEKEINEDNLTDILEAAGADVDKARVKALTTALEDVDIEEAIQSASMPAAAPAPAPEAEATEEPTETEEEEEAPEEEEEEEEEGAAGLGDLFG